MEQVKVPSGLESKYDKYEQKTMIRTKCSVCKQCWKYIGNATCIYGGPYKGYEAVETPKEGTVPEVPGQGQR